MPLSRDWEQHSFNSNKTKWNLILPQGSALLFCGWHCITSPYYPLIKSLNYQWDYVLFEYWVVLMHKTRIWGGGEIVFTMDALSHLSGCQGSLRSTESFLSIPWEVQNFLLEIKMFFFLLRLHFFEAHMHTFIQRVNNPQNSPGSIIMMHTDITQDRRQNEIKKNSWCS